MLCNSLLICCFWCGCFLAGSVDTTGHFLIFDGMVVQAVRQLLTQITLHQEKNCFHS